MKIYRYETRIKYMLFRLQYWEKFEQLRKSLGVVLEASDALRNSEPFKKLLQLILLLGNYMNGSSQQGGAFGMRIDSINKLADTKASDETQLTLLHCLVGIVRRQFPAILDFLTDLKDIHQATRGMIATVVFVLQNVLINVVIVMASISEIVQQYTEMRQGLKQLGLELEAHWPNPNDISQPKEKLINNDQGTDNKPEDPKRTSEGNSLTSSRNSADINEKDSLDNNKDCSETGSLNDGERNEEDIVEDVDPSDGNNVNKEQFAEIDSAIEKESLSSVEEIEEETFMSLDRFQQVMEDYRNSANNRFEELEALYINVDAKWKDVMLYYGENPKMMRPQEFFNIFSHFVHSWKTASMEELEYTSRIEREERRKVELEEKRKAVKKDNTDNPSEDNPVVSVSDHTDNDRRVMDTLLEQLRSGKVENKVRQRRRIKELKSMKSKEELKKSIPERRKATPLTVKLERRGSASSVTSFDQVPAISAEELLNSLMQEED